MKRVAELGLFNVIPLLLATALFAYLIISGQIDSSPDTRTFNHWVKDFINSDFDILAFYGEAAVTPGWNKIQYIVPISLFSLFDVTTGNWVGATYWLNIVIVFLLMIVLFFCIKKITDDYRIAALSISLMCITPEFLFWPKYILTDTIYLFFAFISVIQVLLGQDIRAPKKLFLFLIALIVVMSSRPTSVFYLLSISLYFVFIYFASKKSLGRLFLFTAPLVLVLIGLLFASGLYYQIFYGSIDVPSLRYFALELFRGEVVLFRSEYSLGPVDSFIDIARVIFYRWVAFFSPYLEDYTAHRLLLQIVTVSVYVSSVILLPFIWGRLDNLSKKTSYFIFILTLLVSALHAVTMIDSDFRYRYPLIPFWIVNAAIVYSFIFRRIAHAR